MRKILLATALSVAAISGCAKSDNKEQATAEAEAKLPTMTVDEVDRALVANEVRAVDCNSEKTRKRTGVVPGAILVTDDESYAITELPADKSTKLVFYCASSG